ncbi:hypothetical protein [Roseivivax sediminis]|uniref:Uncharacterized protein n=1 Tax=Roseivivax sediminis TaxID=936889 RepID=A0A1I2B5M3_9RHOB|nr:hypothetical protein [Roseivivax sediminis]SFE51349.1 hypothetical protein SAMN04515678_110199 [Roseivivax sediminis]
MTRCTTLFLILPAAALGPPQTETAELLVLVGFVALIAVPAVVSRV